MTHTEASQQVHSPARDLHARMVGRIRADGPMTVAAFMAEALYDPTAGYYATKDPIGAGQDYVTAPEISQMFGELIGLWCLQTWIELGSPRALRLIELGPGRGTLMADILRTARVREEFLKALKVTLVDVSPALQAAQAQTLAGAPVVLDTAADLPAPGAEPAIILANEYLDCLPIRQFVRLNGAWRERLVGLTPQAPDRLAFVMAPGPLSALDAALIPEQVRDAHDGALVEVRPATQHVADRVAQRLTAHGGRALFIDYGPGDTELGDTLQAVRGHAKVAPLEAPGDQDLTARVDFGALAQAGRRAGLDVAGPKPQGRWLVDLGLEQRAAALMQAQPAKTSALAAQVLRLTDPGEMGDLFKVACLSAPDLPPAAGF